METQLTLFDYNALDAETRIVVQQEDKEFDRNMGDAGISFIRACHNLKRIHATLKYGRPGFVEYCNSKSGLSQQTANRMINVAEMLPETSNISASKEALYLIASPSTPVPARIEAVQRAEQGETITHSTAQEIVATHKPLPYLPANEPDDFDYDQPSMGGIDLSTGEIVTPMPADNRIPALRALQSSESNEWYTPAEYIEAARLVMGGIDLDPASNPIANKIVKAERYYTINDDGFAQDWRGRIWLNPPYGRDGGESNQEKWSARLIEEYRAGNISSAILLVNAVTDRRWFNPLWDFPICFTDHRIRFYSPDTEAGQPTHGNVLVYFGNDTDRFYAHFRGFGPIVPKVLR